MTLISYAQNFEDVILWRALKDIKNGFYIDIGAQDPRDDSVSALFYENGWRGAHVEPSPQFAGSIREARPDEDVLELVIGQEDGEIEFFKVGTSGLNTGMKDVAEQHAAEGWNVSSLTLPSMRLSTLLDRYADRDIHWMKIDVEGMEGAVLASWKPASGRPWVLVIESTLPNSTVQNHEAWEPTVVSMGYRFAYFDGLNRFYVHESHADRMRHFGPGPNVFDDFVLERSLQYHHRAALAIRLADEKSAEVQESRTVLARVRHSLEQQLSLGGTAPTPSSDHQQADLDALLASVAASNDSRQKALEELRSSAAELDAMRLSSAAEMDALRLSSAAEREELRSRAAELEEMLQRRDSTLIDALDQKSKVEQCLAEAIEQRCRETAEGLRLRSVAAQSESTLLARLAECEQLRSEASSAAADARHRLEAVYESTSWKATRPLRSTKLLWVGARTLIKDVSRAPIRSLLSRALPFLRRHPRVRGQLWKLICRFPSIERRALAFVLARPPVPGTKGLPLGADWMLDPEPRSLSLWGSMLNSEHQKV